MAINAIRGFNDILPGDIEKWQFIATMGERAREWASKTKYDLNVKGIWVEIDYEGKSTKSQMRRADKIGAWPYSKIWRGIRKRRCHFLLLPRS